ncbi:MAG: hybrid sensor histidine kinase/response regulator, partial [Polyangiaceae bacterium]|nr:hybrid sensor histidine kinase/response regulator [Polyangiaceae bacterium]
SGHTGPELFALDELVRAQGGSLVVLAKRPSGSTVSILLPLSPG